MESTLSTRDSVNGTCVLCESELVGSARSFEHVIPESLGGRSGTKEALCRDCNSRTGHDWDAQLSKQLLPFSQLVFPADHRSGPKPRRIRDSRGNGLILKAGIRGGAEHPQIAVRKAGERGEIVISAATRKRAVQEIRRLVKAGDIPSNLEGDLVNGLRREETETRIQLSECGSVGGEAVWNSWLKSMVTAGVLGGFARQDMLLAVESLLGRGAAAPMLPIRDSCVQQSSRVPIPERRHCVHVEANELEGAIWGYTEYFGSFTAIAQLGVGYGGRPLKWTYCVDPVTGDDLSRDVFVDLTTAKNLLKEVRAAPDMGQEVIERQAPDLQPLLDECLGAHGIEGKADIVSAWMGSGEVNSDAEIYEMTLIDRERD